MREKKIEEAASVHNKSLEEIFCFFLIDTLSFVFEEARKSDESLSLLLSLILSKEMREREREREIKKEKKEREKGWKQKMGMKKDESDN